MTAPFAVVNMRDGSRRDREPFLLNNDSFPYMENAYLYRGRIERRSAFKSIGYSAPAPGPKDGRLKFELGSIVNPPGTGFVFNIPFQTGFGPPVNTATFIVNNGLTPVVFTDDGTGTNTFLSTQAGSTCTFNYLPPFTVTIALAAAVPNGTTVSYAPGVPVMGLRLRELSLASSQIINDEETIAFDTRFSYNFIGGIGDWEGINYHPGPTLFAWTGEDFNFFDTCSYAKAFWATNNIQGYHISETATVSGEADGIRWYDGTWKNFNPSLNVATTSFLRGGLLILPYRNRLVVLAPYEGNNVPATNPTRFPQRARWSQNGTPFYGVTPAGLTAQPDSWQSDKAGKGGFIDAPTAEEIIGAEFIKDTLVVYFERSTWQLVYSNNEILPFYWEKINIDLGSESTFSTVPFDDVVLAVAFNGITACNSVAVDRIDQKIPDDVFNFYNKNHGVQRVQGIRDFPTQLVYWTYPNDDQKPFWPNRVLVYNYLDGSWATFTDHFTVFGYHTQFNDVTWGTAHYSWESAEKAWNSGALQGKYPLVIAGNQRGYVSIFNQTEQNGLNDPSLTLNNLTGASGVTTQTVTITSLNHNFQTAETVYFMLADSEPVAGLTGITGSAGFFDNIYRGTVVDGNTITFINNAKDPAGLDRPITAAPYLGAGYVRIIPTYRVETKLFNPFYEQGKSVRLSRMEVLADKTDNGKIKILYYPSYSLSRCVKSDTMETSQDNNPSFQSQEDVIWHRIYSNMNASFIQIVFSLIDDAATEIADQDALIRDLAITSDDITIEGFLLYMEPTGNLLT